MIEQVDSSRPDLLEFRISGTVTDRDYKDVLMPALDAAIAEHERIRLLVRFDAGFKDFTLGALVDDSRMGLKHWRGFDRVAAVTDSPWMTRAIKGFSIFMPCPVMTFALADTDAARSWLDEPLGSVHQTDLGDGVLQVQMIGKLDSNILASEVRDLDAYIRRHLRFRLLLDLRQFDGWQGLGAVAEHFKVIREHHATIDRAAVVGDATWQKLGERVLSNFVRARTRYFPSAEFDAAKDWIKSD